MAVKIRLQRQGKKGKPFYHIVSADAKAKRDGRYIERIGTYNPNTNPATINIKFDRALYWIQSGAQPTDTVKALLSHEGVLLKHHLDRGVKKGAFNEAEATKRFEAWRSEKDAKIQGKVDTLSAAAQVEADKRYAQEKEQNEARAQEIAAKNSPLVEETEAVSDEAPAAEAATEEAPVVEAKAEEAPAEAPATEEAKPEGE